MASLWDLWARLRAGGPLVPAVSDGAGLGHADQEKAGRGRMGCRPETGPVQRQPFCPRLPLKSPVLHRVEDKQDLSQRRARRYAQAFRNRGAYNPDKSWEHPRRGRAPGPSLAPAARSVSRSTSRGSANWGKLRQGALKSELRGVVNKGLEEEGWEYQI